MVLKGWSFWFQQPPYSSNVCLLFVLFIYFFFFSAKSLTLTFFGLATCFL